MAHAEVTGPAIPPSGKATPTPPETPREGPDLAGILGPDWIIKAGAVTGGLIVSLTCYVCNASGATSIAIGLAVASIGLLVENLRKTEHTHHEIKELRGDVSTRFDDAAKMSTARFNELTPLVTCPGNSRWIRPA